MSAKVKRFYDKITIKYAVFAIVLTVTVVFTSYGLRSFIINSDSGSFQAKNDFAFTFAFILSLLAAEIILAVHSIAKVIEFIFRRFYAKRLLYEHIAVDSEKHDERTERIPSGWLYDKYIIVCCKNKLLVRKLNDLRWAFLTRELSENIMINVSYGKSGLMNEKYYISLIFDRGGKLERVKLYPKIGEGRCELEEALECISNAAERAVIGYSKAMELAVGKYLAETAALKTEFDDRVDIDNEKNIKNSGCISNITEAFLDRARVEDAEIILPEAM